MVTRKDRKPVFLGKRQEDILKAMRFYRYMTALDVCYLLYKPSVITEVRRVLSELSGGDDFVKGKYLYRLRMPDIGKGNPERVYTLGSKGRDLLTSEFELSVDWYFRPDKVTHMNYSQLMHNLVLTRFLVAADRWAAAKAGFRLSDMRICYELAAKAGAVAIGEGEGKEKVPVVPDAWLLFERFRGRVFEESLPVVVEIDRGTMYRVRFKTHVRERIEFVRSGGYKRVFGTEGSGLRMRQQWQEQEKVRQDARRWSSGRRKG